MTASVREALLAAQAKRDEQMLLEHVSAPSEPLKQAVHEWSQDDSAHIDPPAPNPAPEDLYANQGIGRGANGREQPRGPKGNTWIPTNNVTRETFEFIRDNPGKTRKEILDHLVNGGFKAGSVSSLVGQFTLQRKIFIKEGKYYPAQAEYTPLKSGKAREALALERKAKKTKPVKTKPAAQVKPPEETKPLDTAHRDAPKAQPTKDVVDIVRAHGVIGTQHIDLRHMDADQIVEMLGLKQARALYVKLKEVFSA